MERVDGRKKDELRKTKITRDYLLHPDGSVLVEVGNTKIICTAMIENKVPPFLRGSDTGWVTAEYSMLPGSTNTRKMRDSRKGKVDGRSQEIQRLIGRSMRSVVDLKLLGERTLWLDCDVIQADGGTRTASISGVFVAMVDAFYKLVKEGKLEKMPVKSFVSAVSVGVFEENNILDLCYLEDSNAKVDMNIVMTDKEEFIEVQGTGEEAPFTMDELTSLLEIGKKGCNDIFEIQRNVLGKEIYELIGE